MTKPQALSVGSITSATPFSLGAYAAWIHTGTLRGCVQPPTESYFAHCYTFPAPQVQEETQRAEVARLRRHLRRAAEAAAAAEDAVAATSASCGGGCVGSGVAGPALAATQALATAYEQHVEALQKQVGGRL